MISKTFSRLPRSNFQNVLYIFRIRYLDILNINCVLLARKSSQKREIDPQFWVKTKRAVKNGARAK